MSLSFGRFFRESSGLLTSLSEWRGVRQGALKARATDLWKESTSESMVRVTSVAAVSAPLAATRAAEMSVIRL